MILSDMYASQTAFYEMMDAGIYTSEPFEFLIKTIYENEMIIQSANLYLMAKDYEYLRETGDELTFIGEGGIISTIFGGLFKIIKKAAQSVASFFKSVFNKNSEKIEQTKTEENQKTQTSTIQKSTHDTDNISEKNKANIATTANRTSDNKAAKSNDIDTNDMYRALNNIKKLEADIKKLKNELSVIESDTIKNILKDPKLLDDINIDRRLIRIDSSKFLNTADTYSNYIIDKIINSCSDILHDEYNSFNNVYGNGHFDGEYMHDLNNRDFSKDADKFESGKFKLSVDTFNKILSSRIKILPKHFRVIGGRGFAGELEDYEKDHLISTTQLSAIIDESVLTGKKNLQDDYIKEMENIKSQCSKLFERAKKVIKSTEDNLKKLQGYAQQTESHIQHMQSVGNVGGDADPEKAKKMLSKYFNGLNQCVSSLITQSTNINLMVQRDYGSFITLSISNNKQFIQDYNAIPNAVNKIISHRKAEVQEKIDIYTEKVKKLKTQI